MKRCFILFFLAATAFGKVIYYGDSPEPVRIVYGGATLFRFPADVRTISQAQRFEIQPADPEQPNYSLLSIRPRFTTGSSEVAFILSDGSVARLRLTIVGNSEMSDGDSLYELRSRDTSLEPDKIHTDLSAVELMKAMIRSESVSGYIVRSRGQEIVPGFKGVRTRLVRLYTGERFYGYIFEVVNQSKENLSMNIQNLMVGDPNSAIMSYSDRDILESAKGDRGKAYLYIVAKPTKRANELILPIETVEKR